MPHLAAMPGMLPVIIGIALIAFVAVTIRLFWRRKTTPWDA